MDTSQCGTSPHVSHTPRYLSAVLAKDGHQIILEQIEDWNLVELVVNEETVFQCDIQELEFGKAGEASVQPSVFSEWSLHFQWKWSGSHA